MPKNQCDRINELATSVALYNKDNDFMKKEILKIGSKIDKLEEKFDLFSEQMESKYAKKSSVDKLRVIVWTVIGVVFTAVWGAILSLVIK